MKNSRPDKFSFNNLIIPRHEILVLIRIKAGGRNINNLRYADDTTLMTEGKEELKNLLMGMKEESETASLKLNIKKTKRSQHPAPSLHDKKRKRWK